jgi:hypothetical protein
MALNLEEYRSGEDMNGFQYQSFLPSHINDRWIWDTRIRIGNTNGLLRVDILADCVDWTC